MNVRYLVSLIKENCNESSFTLIINTLKTQGWFYDIVILYLLLLRIQIEVATRTLGTFWVTTNRVYPLNEKTVKIL